MISKTQNTKTYQLWELCHRFVKDYEISCAESIYQVDSIQEDALAFIEDICNIVGYYETPDNETSTVAAKDGNTITEQTDFEESFFAILRRKHGRSIELRIGSDGRLKWYDENGDEFNA